MVPAHNLVYIFINKHHKLYLKWTTPIFVFRRADKTILLLEKCSAAFLFKHEDLYASFI